MSEILTTVPQAGDGKSRLLYLATVAAVSSGHVKLTFAGESTSGGKYYKRLASYSSPTAGDLVLAVKIGGSFVVLGKIV